MKTISVRLVAALLAAAAWGGAGAEIADARGTAASAATSASAKARPARCTGGERPLTLSGLCRKQAEALLLKPGGSLPAAMAGCRWVLRETPFADNILLYRTLRCGGTEAKLEFQAGNRQTDLVYVEGPGKPVLDADGKPLALARIFAGHPDGRARALRVTRDSIDDKRAAARCTLRRPYRSEGYPPDALIVDVPRTPADLQRDDAGPACGPFGFNPMAEAFDFWRTHQGYAWYLSLGTDVWSIDPATLTLIRKNAAGRWEALPTPPRG